MHKPFGDLAKAENGHSTHALAPPVHETEDSPHHQVASADPLGFNDLYSDVPKLNGQADVQGLVDLLRAMLGLEPGAQRIPSPADLPLNTESWGRAQAAAAMRDIGLVIESIRRHGQDAVELLPGLEPLLNLMAEKSDLPPRLTLLHYTLWNPERRARTFTSLPEELELIHSTKVAFPAQEQAILHLDMLFGVPLDSSDFALTAQKIHYNIAAIRSATVGSFQGVDQRVFARSIRPYLEPFKVRGQELLGPGVVAVPLYLFDHLLWSAQSHDGPYGKFKASMVPSTLPHLRPLYHRYEAEGCFLDRLLPFLIENPPRQSPEIDAALRALDRVFSLIQQFRSIHMRMARPDILKLPSELEHGSGSHHPDLLSHIYRLAARAQKRLQIRIPHAQT